MLVPGTPAPWFNAPVLGGNAAFAFDTAGGRWVVMLFQGSGAWPSSAGVADLLADHRHRFDDVSASLFGISIDGTDATQGRIPPQSAGVHWFLDEDRMVSRRFGAIESEGGQARYRPHWLLLDPMLRVHATAAIGDGAAVMAMLAERLAAPIDLPAPVLVLPGVFDAAICRELIATYDREGGRESGFMVERDGITMVANDYKRKRRADCLIDEGPLQQQLRARLRRFLVPMISRAFQTEVTRIERWLVACYDGEAGGGYFRAHRDNTTRGTAHRRFACTINLNAEEYEGGDLRFPEFGPRTYRAPTGGAVIFSCSLQHEALPVTRGRRYAFLPFFYDEAGAALRERNLAHVSPELANYRSGLDKP